MKLYMLRRAGGREGGNDRMWKRDGEESDRKEGMEGLIGGTKEWREGGSEGEKEQSEEAVKWRKGHGGKKTVGNAFL